jgi:hypothetical protein
MTAKNYLKQIKSIKKRVKALAEQLACMREVAGLASSVMSTMPRSPNRNIHGLENDVMRHIDWEDKIASELDRLEEIMSAVAAVSDPILHTLLVKRYVEDCPWDVIAGELSYSLPQVYRLHGTALLEIERMIANESQ